MRREKCHPNLTATTQCRQMDCLGGQHQDLNRACEFSSLLDESSWNPCKWVLSQLAACWQPRRKGHLAGQVNKSADVGCGCGLPVAHVDHVCLVLQNLYERSGEAYIGLRNRKTQDSLGGTIFKNASTLSRHWQVSSGEVLCV